VAMEPPLWWLSSCLALFSILVVLAIPYLPVVQPAVASHPQQKPNILFVFTDDQDLELGSLNYLNVTRSRIQEQGQWFPVEPITAIDTFCWN
jgi:hypothetical protein